ncbi:MAG TPA: hypothetical protein VH596_18320 [Terriglobales bacterium]
MPLPGNPSDSALFVQYIRHEIERLTKEQDDAVQAARLGGMTPEGEEEFHERRRKITKLTQDLAIFEDA